MSDGTLLAVASNISYDDTYTPERPTSTSSLSLSRRCSAPVSPLARIPIPGDTYVPHLCHLPPNGPSRSIAAALSGANVNAVWTVDLDTATPVTKFTEHADVVTGLAPNADGLIASSSRDGSVRVWDPRGNGAMTIWSRNRVALTSCAFSSPATHLLAAGSEAQSDGASLIFWDMRSPVRPIHQHDSTHSDDITVLKFNPQASPTVILSGSADGLLSLSDATQPDEDEAVLQVFNWEKSVSKGGWTADGGVWGASDMETFAILDDQLNLKTDLGDLRLPRVEGVWESNYIIDAQVLNPNTPLNHHSKESMAIWMGRNDGSFALFDHRSSGKLKISRIFNGGHTAIVRSTLDQGDCIVTGGEDSMICIWPVHMGGEVEDTIADVEMASEPTSPSSSKKRRKDEEHDAVDGDYKRTRMEF